MSPTDDVTAFVPRQSRGETPQQQRDRAERARTRQILADAAALVEYERALAAGKIKPARQPDATGLHVVPMPANGARARAANLASRPAPTAQQANERRELRQRISTELSGKAQRFAKYIADRGL